MNLDKIGVEVEYNIKDYNNYVIDVNNYFKNHWTYINWNTKDNGKKEFDSFIPIYKEISAQLTDEYYSSQCEWKFFPVKIDKIKDLQEAIHKTYSIYYSTLWEKQLYHSSLPAFVWTHIHLFFKENWKDINRFVRWKTILSAFLMEYFYYFLRDNPKKLSNTLVVKELERLCFNHNILQKLDYKLLNKWIRRNLNNKCFDYYYTNIPKDKYQPVHWSNPSNGKPLTLELRFIPNSFIIFSKAKELEEFITTVTDKVLYINSLSGINFNKEHEKNIQQCIFWHSKLLDLYLLKNNFWYDHLPRFQAGNSRELKLTKSIINQYINLRKNWYDHTKSFKMAKKDSNYYINNYLDNKSSFISEQEIKESVYSIYYTKNIQYFLDRFKDKINTIYNFPESNIDNIIKKHIWNYDMKDIEIDTEWFEIYNPSLIATNPIQNMDMETESTIATNLIQNMNMVTESTIATGTRNHNIIASAFDTDFVNWMNQISGNPQF